MKKTLYVHNDAPPELKENIRLTQQCLDNMLLFKAKADNGTLSLDDLETMTRRNNDIIDQFSKGDPSLGRLPKQQVNSPAAMDSLVKSRLNETGGLAGNKKSPYPVSSIKELNNLCRKPPETISSLIIDAAKEEKQKRKAAEAAREDDLEIREVAPRVKMKSPGKRFNDSLLFDYLEEVTGLLNGCKQIYYDLTMNWTDIEEIEQMMTAHLDAFAEHHQLAVDFLLSYLTEKTEDKELEEKKPVAAFILASMVDEDRNAQEKLLDHLRNNKDSASLVVQALKYGQHPEINDTLDKNLPQEPPYVQAGYIEALNYRKVINPARWSTLYKKADPSVKANILRSYVIQGNDFNRAELKSLLEDPEAPFYEDAVFTALFTGEISALAKCRSHFQKKDNKMIKLPLFLACASEQNDFFYIKNNLDNPASKNFSIMALGILGQTRAITLLLDLLIDEKWLVQRRISDSLELITGAELDLPLPEIIEGPEGKEYEVTVKTGWDKIWTHWWMGHHHNFDPNLRYRRGQYFDLGSCINEMKYPRGNHWSRQYAYYELLIRSGCHVARFEADWYVKDQQAAINAWEEWWQKDQDRFNHSQWLYAGK